MVIRYRTKFICSFGESGSFRNLDLSSSRFFASLDDVGAASIRIFEGVFRLVNRVRRKQRVP
jgi:hypothetical protein